MSQSCSGQHIVYQHLNCNIVLQAAWHVAVHDLAAALSMVSVGMLQKLADLVVPVMH